MCSECVILTSLFQNHDKSLWLVVYDKNFSGGTGVVTLSKSPLPTKNFCLNPPLFQDVLPKTGTILDRICVNTVNYISFQKSDLYDNGTMSFTCEHSPNWQVFCPQIMAEVTLAFFHVV